MTDNINVKPSTDQSSVSIATDVIDSVHYPVYKLAIGKDGVANLITDDGIPIYFTEVMKAHNNEVVQAINKLEKQLKIMNMHLSMITDNEVTKAELE